MKNSRKQVSVQHPPPHREDPSTQPLLPRKINVPALPGDKQARRTGTPLTAHRRHAGARAARQKTTPEGLYGRTDRTNQAPRRTLPPKNTTKPLYPHRSQQTQPQGKQRTEQPHPMRAREPEQQSRPSRAPEAGTSSKKKAADATPPHPARKQHDPPRGRRPPPQPNTEQPSAPKLPPRTGHRTAHYRHQSQQSEATPPTRGVSQRGPTTPATSPQQTHMNPGRRRDHPYTLPGRRNHTKRHSQPPKPSTERRGTPRQPAELKHPGRHHKRTDARHPAPPSSSTAARPVAHVRHHGTPQEHHMRPP
ncbi:basic salivary proline-rich protein 3-like [Cyprinodon tularosa]|uniref:basic salivary proline-rich protein 3-like n=1 Tax=Cyprinodon tularosa TaxID=77115 RepID=UPI0018E1DBBE|nr:basic salivary proline-rich protein 3-like [Cyprinodon tularosa]